MGFRIENLGIKNSFSSTKETGKFKPVAAQEKHTEAQMDLHSSDVNLRQTPGAENQEKAIRASLVDLHLDYAANLIKKADVLAKKIQGSRQSGLQGPSLSNNLSSNPYSEGANYSLKSSEYRSAKDFLEQTKRS